MYLNKNASPITQYKLTIFPYVHGCTVTVHSSPACTANLWDTVSLSLFLCTLAVYPYNLQFSKWWFLYNSRAIGFPNFVLCSCKSFSRKDSISNGFPLGATWGESDGYSWVNAYNTAVFSLGWRHVLFGWHLYRPKLGLIWDGEVPHFLYTHPLAGWVVVDLSEVSPSPSPHRWSSYSQMLCRESNHRF